MLHLLWHDYKFHEDTYNLYEDADSEFIKYAKQYFDSVTDLNIASCNAGKITEDKKDILLGFPTWHENPVTSHNWVKENALEKTREAHPNSYLIMPWTTSLPAEWTMPHIQQQLSAARKVFAVCGEYWFEKTQNLSNDSLQSIVKNKLIRINKGCAAHLLPFKKKFAKKDGGLRRNFFHISDASPRKRLDVMTASLAGTEAELYVASPSLKKGNYSASIDANKVFSFDSVGYVHNSNPGFNDFIMDECDFYIHTSENDAQAAPIIENCARGLVPIITKESGFSSEHAIYIGFDANENREIILEAMNMSDEEYEKRSQGVREEILIKHSWDNIFNTIWNTIQDTKA